VGTVPNGLSLAQLIKIIKKIFVFSTEFSITRSVFSVKARGQFRRANTLNPLLHKTAYNGTVGRHDLSRSSLFDSRVSLCHNAYF
jgi:SPX domain protein involved in polyphosphate accumulation